MASKEKTASLVIRVMQNKITRHHYTPTGMVKLKRLIILNGGENVELLKYSCIAGKNVKNAKCKSAF